MKKNYVFMADGFEDIEALATVDILRRAGMEVDTVSISGTYEVTSAHGVTIKTDITLEECDTDDAEWLILPGGMPGASNLRACQPLCDALMLHDEKNGNIAAICASPTIVLATLGLLQGRDATCYPGMENDECGVKWNDAMVVVDQNIVTGRGPAAACDFALAIVGKTRGAAVANAVAEGMLLQ